MGFNDTRCVLEPAGALAIAGMVKYIKENKTEGCTYVAISSGANMDFDRYVGIGSAITLILLCDVVVDSIRWARQVQLVLPSHLLKGLGMC